jgi:predicted O-linked N-acetylglucosamine transferase (SPINDLY family)
MEQLIAADPAALQALAIDLLTDRARLVALRRALPERVRASPLGDPTAGARMLEAAFIDCIHG